MRTNRSGLKLVSRVEPLAASQVSTDAVSDDDYRIAAAWRDTLRNFMGASKVILKQASVTPHQYQALLAIRTSDPQHRLTMGELASVLQIRHNSAVTLINKLADRGLVKRIPSQEDRRVVHLLLTPKGETTLRKLVAAHRHELDVVSPVLREVLP
jgi:DNA-binding MarR family transcriptional regulator